MRFAVTAALLATTVTAWAGEDVLLTNGFRLHADRHETDGAVVRIYDTGGVREIPASSIAGYDVEDREPVREIPAQPEGVLPQAPAAQQVPEPLTPQALPGPHELAREIAARFSLPEGFLRSVMRTESGFNSSAVSPKGAIGLMQLMPGTARQLGVDPHDPRQNAEGGARYLRDLLALYENRPDQVLLALAAYNAGPGAVAKYNGVPPYRETREYILRVLKNWDLSAAR